MWSQAAWLPHPQDLFAFCVIFFFYLQDTDTRTGRDRDCDRCALRLPTALVALAEPTWSLKLVADCWCRLKVVFILARAATFALLAHVRRFPSLGFHFQ